MRKPLKADLASKGSRPEVVFEPHKATEKKEESVVISGRGKVVTARPKAQAKRRVVSAASVTVATEKGPARGGRTAKPSLPPPPPTKIKISDLARQP